VLLWRGPLLGGQVHARFVLSLLEGSLSVRARIGHILEPGPTYGNLKIHKLVRERAHFIVEAELVFAALVRGEDKVALPLFLAVHHHLAPWPGDLVVNIEGAARLYLIEKSQYRL
jgi:hypothetical protein